MYDFLQIVMVYGKIVIEFKIIMIFDISKSENNKIKISKNLKNVNIKILIIILINYNLHKNFKPKSIHAYVLLLILQYFNKSKSV